MAQAKCQGSTHVHARLAATKQQNDAAEDDSLAHYANGYQPPGRHKFGPLGGRRAALDLRQPVPQPATLIALRHEPCASAD